MNKRLIIAITIMFTAMQLVGYLNHKDKVNAVIINFNGNIDTITLDKVDTLMIIYPKHLTK